VPFSCRFWSFFHRLSLTECLSLIGINISECLVIHNFRVQPNNQAERNVRNIKTRHQGSGCFQTDGDAQNDSGRIQALGWSMASARSRRHRGLFRQRNHRPTV